MDSKMSDKHELDGAKSAAELRAKFLRDAEPVMRFIVARAKGAYIPDVHVMSADPEYVGKVWKALEPMLIAAGDIQRLELKTTVGIIDAVCKGKMTAKEGLLYMQLLKDQQDVDTIPKLLEQLQEGN